MITYRRLHAWRNQRASTVLGLCTALLMGLAPSGTNAREYSFTKDRMAVFPNLVPDSVTVTAVNTSENLSNTNNTFRHTYRICVKNTGLSTAKPPSSPGWWSIIISYPDDKGGRPNAYYWSRHKITQSLGQGQTYCFNRDIYITNCRANPPRIRVSADADKGITESNENDNSKDFYPRAFCSGG